MENENEDVEYERGIEGMLHAIETQVNLASRTLRKVVSQMPALQELVNQMKVDRQKEKAALEKEAEDL